MSQSAVLTSIAEQTLQWPFRMWSFGEAIALDGLLAAARVLERPHYHQHVAALCLATIARGVGRSGDDHLVPGRAFLQLHRDSGDPRYLDAARALITLHESLPTNPHGALLVRAHQAGWRHQIWVDSMDVIGPLFAHFAAETGEVERFETGIALTLAHARLLQHSSGLFFHGYDTHAGPNGHFWARGAGWAVLGMSETLALSPRDTPGWAELHQRFVDLLDALAGHQCPSGLWTTVLGRVESYEETTLAAMSVHAHRIAVAAGLIAPGTHAGMIAAARRAVRAQTGADGALGLVSEATPVGQFSTYSTRPFGIFPWGQGPLLLMECDQ